MMKNKEGRKKRIVNIIDEAIIRENAKTDYDLLDFALTFNQLLFDKDYTQEEFYIATNEKVSPTSISNYRSGKSMPKIDMLEIMADTLGVSVNFLKGKSEYPKYSSERINNILGMEPYAMEHLYCLRHDIPECEDLDNDLPTSDVYKKQLETLSLLISDKKNLLHILQFIREYIDKKQEIKELETEQETETSDEEPFSKKEKIKELKMELVPIKSYIEHFLYMSLDDISNKF